MGEDQRIPPFDLRLQPRRVVANRIASALIVVVRPRHPAGFIARIAHFLIAIEGPCHIAFPVNLDQIEHILHTVARVALAAVSEDRPARQNFIGEAVELRPFPHHGAVHIDKHRAVLGGLEKGIAAPRARRIVKRRAGRENGRMAHVLLLSKRYQAEVIR